MGDPRAFWQALYEEAVDEANWWLMPYHNRPNRSVWWQPHPLLMISALAGTDAP